MVPSIYYIALVPIFFGHFPVFLVNLFHNKLIHRKHRIHNRWLAPCEGAVRMRGQIDGTGWVADTWRKCQIGSEHSLGPLPPCHVGSGQKPKATMCKYLVVSKLCLRRIIAFGQVQKTTKQTKNGSPGGPQHRRRQYGGLRSIQTALPQLDCNASSR